MFEQFRLLHTALRLREFTIAELAEASSVAEATVQKTLRRRRDLFSKTDKTVPGRSRRAVSIYEVDAGAVVGQLQVAADAPEELRMPTTAAGVPLALEVARDTLLSRFPEASVEDRRPLLDAARQQLSVVRDEDEQGAAKLAQLHELLSTVVAIYEWLRSLSSWRAKTTNVTVLQWKLVNCIDEVLSADRRTRRDKETARLQGSASTLLRVQEDSVRLATYVTSSAPEPPSRLWCANLTAAVWSLIGNESWQKVAGDLAQIDNLCAALDAEAASRIRDTAALNQPVGAVDLYVDAPGWGGGQMGKATFEWSDRPAGTFRKKEAFGTGFLGGSNVKYTAYHTEEANLRVVLSNPLEVFPNDGFGIRQEVTSIYVDLVRQLVLGATVRGPAGGESWVPYRNLVIKGQEPIRLERAAAFEPSPQTSNLEVKEGECLRSGDTLGLALRSSFSLVTVPQQGNSIFASQLERKMAEIWFLDVEAETGRLTAARGVMSGTGREVVFPSANLTYDGENRCFRLTGSAGSRSEISEIWTTTARYRIGQDVARPTAWRTP